MSDTTVDSELDDAENIDLGPRADQLLVISGSISRLIDRRSKKLLAEDRNRVSAAAFSRDDRLAFIVIEDDRAVSMIIRDAQSGQSIATVELLKNPVVGNSFLLTAALLASASAIALRGFDKWIELVPLFEDFSAAAARAGRLLRNPTRQRTGSSQNLPKILR